MELKRTFRSGIVLLELLASILIFAIASAVCVRVLVKADQVSAQARLLSDGVTYASSAAEILRSADSAGEGEEAICRAWPQTQRGEDLRISLEEGTLTISRQQRDSLTCYRILWSVSGEQLYELDLHRFFEGVTP